MGIAGVRSATQEKFISSGSTGEPNWDYIPSYSKSEKTQDEFSEEIRKLAKQAASTTDENKLSQINKQVMKLRAEYVSSVSPNRKKMYSSAKNLIENQKNTKNTKCKGVGELSLLNFLEDSEKALSEQRYAVAGGELSFAISSYGGYDAMISTGGTQIFGTTNGQWTYQMTAPELEKKDEFYSIYWKAYRGEKASSEELIDLPEYIEQKSILDVKA